MENMKKDSRFYVVGSRGLIGSTLTRNLVKLGYSNIITKTRDEFDLTNTLMVDTFSQIEKPRYVYFAAAQIGGIIVNTTQLVKKNVFLLEFTNEPCTIAT